MGVKVGSSRVQLAKVQVTAKADDSRVLEVSVNRDGPPWQLTLKPVPTKLNTEGATNIVRVTATDERGSTTQTSFKVTVLAQPPPPSIDPLVAQELELGQPAKVVPLGVKVGSSRLQLAKVQATAKADDPQVLEVSVNRDDPPWQLTLKPVPTKLNTESAATIVRVTATDERGSTTQVSFNVNVTQSADWRKNRVDLEKLAVEVGLIVQKDAVTPEGKNQQPYQYPVSMPLRREWRNRWTNLSNFFQGISPNEQR